MSCRMESIYFLVDDSLVTFVTIYHATPCATMSFNPSFAVFLCARWSVLYCSSTGSHMVLLYSSSSDYGGHPFIVFSAGGSRNLLPKMWRWLPRESNLRAALHKTTSVADLPDYLVFVELNSSTYAVTRAAFPSRPGMGSSCMHA